MLTTCFALKEAHALGAFDSSQRRQLPCTLQSHSFSSKAWLSQIWLVHLGSFCLLAAFQAPGSNAIKTGVLTSKSLLENSLIELHDEATHVTLPSFSFQLVQAQEPPFNAKIVFQLAHLAGWLSVASLRDHAVLGSMFMKGRSQHWSKKSSHESCMQLVSQSQTPPRSTFQQHPG